MGPRPASIRRPTSRHRRSACGPSSISAGAPTPRSISSSAGTPACSGISPPCWRSPSRRCARPIVPVGQRSRASRELRSSTSSGCRPTTSAARPSSATGTYWRRYRSSWSRRHGCRERGRSPPAGLSPRSSPGRRSFRCSAANARRVEPEPRQCRALPSSALRVDRVESRRAARSLLGGRLRALRRSVRARRRLELRARERRSGGGDRARHPLLGRRVGSTRARGARLGAGPRARDLGRLPSRALRAHGARGRRRGRSGAVHAVARLAAASVLVEPRRELRCPHAALPRNLACRVRRRHDPGALSRSRSGSGIRIRARDRRRRVAGSGDRRRGRGALLHGAQYRDVRLEAASRLCRCRSACDSSRSRARTAARSSSGARCRGRSPRESSSTRGYRSTGRSDLAVTA